MEFQKIPHPVILHAIGGCHINGYPYGFDQSFVSIALADMGRTDVDVRRLAPASFRKINAYLEDRANPVEGSIVVVQMGNHEAMQRSWREKGANIAEPWQSGKDQPLAQRRRVRSFPVVSSLVKCGKLAVFRWRELRGVKFFDPEEFRRRLGESFAALAARRPSGVIVLAAFPANSPEVTICRRRLNAVMKSVTDEFKFEFVDAFSALEHARRTKRGDLFHDTLHLNEKGEQIVSQAIGFSLKQKIADIAEVRVG